MTQNLKNHSNSELKNLAEFTQVWNLEILRKLNSAEHSLANYQSNGIESFCGIKTFEFTQTRNQKIGICSRFFFKKKCFKVKM